MNISFIITTYNVGPYIKKCLESLRPCLRPGDQVILIDDGSSDSTAKEVENFISQVGFGSGIRWLPIWLGTNTIGGVGIPANIGLDHVDRDSVFFIDGDDYLISDEFLLAREFYESNPTDICIADYMVLDEATGSIEHPADFSLWSQISTEGPSEDTRLAALKLISVPWRKFYRAEFLSINHLKFPEGDNFFEDNPFHWRACILAKTINFARFQICHHRINRPGQTMSSTGVELLAFFDHFETIIGYIPKKRHDLRQQAVRWLVQNITWNLRRLHESAMFSYTKRAASVLKSVADKDWKAISEDMSNTITWHYLEGMRQGRVWDVTESLRNQADRIALSKLGQDLEELEIRIEKIANNIAVSTEILLAQKAIDEFVSFKEGTPLYSKKK